MGATKIIGVDTVPARLAAARKLGADHVIDFGSSDPVAEIMRLTNGRVLSVLCALISACRSWVFETGRSGCEHLPLGQGGRAAKLVGLAVNEVAFG